MNHSESIKNIAGAMQEFQSEPMVVGENAQGYGYDYATLDKCVNRIYPRATAHGLSVMQPLADINGEPAILTIIMHVSGEWIQTAYPLAKAGMKQVNDAQQFGAAVTYARRYGLLSAFGVPVGKDDDAASLTQKPTTAAEAIKKAIQKCKTVADLESLYHDHETVVKGDKDLKTAFRTAKGALQLKEQNEGEK